MSQNCSNHNRNYVLYDQSEISLLDVFIFFKGAWKLMILTGFLGLGVSGIYLFTAPSQFEAVTTIFILKAPSPNNVLGINIEDPAALIARMSLPGAFDNEVLASCGFQGGTNDPQRLTQSIKWAVPKGLSSAVELKVNRPTSELAIACIRHIVQSVSAVQLNGLESIVELSRAANVARLGVVEERIRQDRVLLAKPEQPGGRLTPTYFAVLSDIRALEDERVKLTAALNITNIQDAQPQSPIDVSVNHLYPKRSLSLFAGFLGGGFLGLMIALVRQLVAKLNVEAGGT